MEDFNDFLRNVFNKGFNSNPFEDIFMRKGMPMNSMDFINYVSKPISRSQMMYIYNISNITNPRCELYCDFIVSVLELCYTTYLGDDVMDENDRKQHFKWCWDKTVHAFSLEGFDFNDYNELYDYLFSFMWDTFYSQSDKDFDVDELTYYWRHIFNYSKAQKTRSDLDMLVEVYNLFFNRNQI